MMPKSVQRFSDNIMRKNKMSMMPKNVKRFSNDILKNNGLLKNRDLA